MPKIMKILSEKIENGVKIVHYITEDNHTALFSEKIIDEHKDEPIQPPKKNDFDMNKDGKIDEKDVSIIARGLKTLGKRGRPKKG